MKNVSQLLIWIMFLLLLATAAPAQQDNSHDEHFRAVFEFVVNDLNSDSFALHAAGIDQAAWLDAVFGLRLIDPKIKKAVRESVDRDFAGVIQGLFGYKLADVEASLLGVESRGNRARAVVRLDLPKSQFSYLEYDLRREANGDIYIVDWIDFKWGQSAIENFGISLVMNAPSMAAIRKLVDFRSPTERQMFVLGELFKAARDRDTDRYFGILKDADEQIARQKIVVLTSVQLTKALKKRREMRTALQTMSTVFPTEPLYSLMLLDLHFPARKYEEGMQALLRLQQRLGFDDAAMEARLSAVSLAMGDVEDAAAYADKALRLEPDLELAWWSTLGAHVAKSNFAASVEALQTLEDEFGYDLRPDALERNRDYAQLLESSEY